MVVVGVGANPLHTVESVKNLKNSLFGTFQTALSQNGISEEKVTSLQSLKGKVTELASACDQVEEKSIERVNGLVWWKRFLEKLAYFVGLSLGSYATTRFRIQAYRTEFLAQTTHFQKKEFDKLAQYTNPNQASLYFVRLYDVLASLNTEYKAHLAQFADRLIIEGAYNAAIDALNEYMTLNPESKVKPRLIVAMKGAQKYEEALNTINAFNVARNHEGPSLDALKIDCIMGQEKYQEAREELVNLLKGSIDNEALKERMVQVTILDELAQNADRYFMARSKALFGKQKAMEGVSWSDDALGADLFFWTYLLTHEKRVYSDDELLSRVIKEIQDLTTQEMIKPATLIKALEDMARQIEGESTILDKQYHVFMKETAKDIQINEEIKEEIVESRMQKMKGRLHGDENFVGILNLQKAIKRLSDWVSDRDGFTSSEMKTKIQAVKDKCESAVAKLDTLAKSVQAVYTAGFHPYLNKIQLSLGAPEEIRVIAN